MKTVLFLQLLVGILAKCHLINGKDLKILFWIDRVQSDFYNDLSNALKDIEDLHLETEISDSILEIGQEDETVSNDGDQNMNKLCEILASEGASVVIDFSYFVWQPGLDYIRFHHIPYLRVDRLLRPFLQIFAEFLKHKNANDVVIILQNERDEMEALLQITEGYPFRTLLLNAGNGMDFLKRLRDLRPSPSYYGIFAGAKLFARPPEWHFVFLDPKDRVFKYKKLQRALLLDIFRSLIAVRQSNLDWLEPILAECNETEHSDNSELEIRRNFDILDHFPLTNFMTLMTPDSPMQFEDEYDQIIPSLTFMVNISINFYSTAHEAVTDLAAWQNGELRKINETISPAKRFFRIGTAEAIPWSYQRRDPRTGKVSLDYLGKPIWEGFCNDVIAMLSQKMNFEYELVSPTKGRFGERNPETGEWDGIVGDLVSGETDFAVSALKMYSEREEVIDFVAPYFEQTGISIVMRKPVREASLFKFMTVLRLEVWMSIIAALIVTAVMIWLMDKYSPYSSRNNRQAYPYPCREFTLRESFWFALTSFTPQGGGEAPKAISGRVLVAAYWLFVVLMLATFTANLAAFLTVERMQTPVQSLEQLARQSRINYTVVEGSDTHQYFINMKFAEDTLYRMWKELALNASRDFHKFRVWDYPIKEQYGHILLAINSSMPVKTAEDGFHKVNERESADFAFIHDSAEIKYEITRNCNLTEVGEVFAEQPYAVAIQQGSHLADELSYALLELQKDRYFEELKDKYWNRSRSNCPLTEDQEGITLESLGGVFIATLFGLGLAMITLVVEVVYYKNKPFNSLENAAQANIIEVKAAENSVKPVSEAWHTDIERKKITPPPSFEVAAFRGREIPSSITLGNEFKPRKRLLGSAIRTSDGLVTTEDELPPYVE
uniref:Ionotropic glutamate receptor C-terminal domain-containing protein n=1 Tax=Glossina austeni TaxID=7395 RepID=A0A1A9UEK8_GLOAU